MDFDVVARFLFPVPTASYSAESFPEELISVPRSLNPQTSCPEDCLPFLLERSSTSRFLMIYLHSNFEDLGRCRQFCVALRDRLKVHVLAVEYPAYGICPGTHCDERGAIESARTALRFSREVLRWPMSQILIFGRSIGTGPALSVALDNDVGGIILVSPFLSVKDIGRETFGPVANLIQERFPNKDLMPYIRSPVLIIHGQKDAIVPCRHGKRLHEICRSRKKLVTPPDLDHNSNLLALMEFFIEPVLDFFQLPRQGYEEMQVPSWAFDRRFAPVQVLQRETPRMACYACTLTRQCGPTGCSGHSQNGCGLCRSSTHGRGVKAPMRTRLDAAIVEETIACAIEHVLALNDEEARASTMGPPVVVRESTGRLGNGFDLLEDDMDHDTLLDVQEDTHVSPVHVEVQVKRDSPGRHDPRSSVKV
mmetsp:Transcript_20695/g.45426  ORF Transcript_20695/g.45426 Transcript_20695/m.45426 type:complete len:422 (-) Transcript_20695:131-1396(-)|eukprot:CAMPEP_0170587898 /NCGR_PEP_ID=MMETSP0224-20130122/10535_1 /TAXON_ID=285029 /ORGANISM="Togula jolla, Strain CCCM 725" /LENGTH=421 /DNA_ID=CAMNT_0010911565 /DNA_START=51 /DNA_END=1316 /DNA_ORIENTATION=+